MARSNSTTDAATSNHSGHATRLNSPQPRACTLIANPIAPAGISNRHTTLFNTASPKLLNHRSGLLCVSGRRGASNSHTAITSNVPKKHPKRMAASCCGVGMAQIFGALKGRRQVSSGCLTES